jgi:hypothetical protein
MVIITLNNINLLILVMVKCGVNSVVQTEFLNLFRQALASEG